MNEPATKFGIFYPIAGALALVAAFVRTAALLYGFDPAVGYYDTTPLSIGLYCLAALAILFFFSYPLVEKEVPLLPCSDKNNLPTIIAAGMATLLMLGNFAVACTLQTAFRLPFLLWFLGIVFLLVGTVYFALRFLAERPPLSLTLWCGYALVFALAFLLCFTYFDQQVGMNTPRKTDLHLTLIALMFYFLYELRDLAGRPMPRARRVCSMLAFFLSLAVGVSNLVAFTVGVYDSIPYLAQDLLLIGFAAYIGTRMFAEYSAGKSRSVATDEVSV